MNARGRTQRIGRLIALLALLTCAGGARAQQAGSDWTKVQAIATGTPVRVSSQHRPTVCNFVVADSDSLTCIKTQTIFFIPVTHRLVYMKEEVTLVKLSRQFLSGLAGAGIGAGAGAGIGAGLESQYSSKEDGHLATFVFMLLGGSLGAGVGAASDFLAAPTVYRAP